MDATEIQKLVEIGRDIAMADDLVLRVDRATGNKVRITLRCGTKLGVKLSRERRVRARRKR